MFILNWNMKTLHVKIVFKSNIMSIDFYLPEPKEDELNLGYKVDYYTRLLEMDLEQKYKISQNELCDWIHHNYSSIFLTEKELSYNQYKKLFK